VILISDHGMYIGEHGRCGKHTVDPKDPWPLYDEVARIPMLVWSPFKNAPERVKALCQPADIMPTVMDLCGLDRPPTAGRSWKPLLAGEADSLHERIYTSCFSDCGEGKIDILASHLTVNTPTHTAIFGRRPHQPELYDRAADPAQRRNLAAEEPERVARLRADLAEFMTRTGARREYVDAYALGR
jgi:arylsulfatase